MVTFGDQFAPFSQPLPGDIVFLVAHPGIEARVDPRSRVDPRQGARRWELGEKARDGGCLYPIVLAQPAVERPQKGVAIGFVEVPAVLAVERDHRKQRDITLAFLDPMEPIDQVFRAFVAARVLVLEADGIGEPAITEDEVHWSGVRLHLIGRIQDLWLHQLALAVAAQGGPDRAAEQALVTDQPGDALLGRQPNDIVRDRRFRRPESGWLPAKGGRVRLDSKAELF